MKQTLPYSDCLSATGMDPASFDFQSCLAFLRHLMSLQPDHLGSEELKDQIQKLEARIKEIATREPVAQAV